MNPQKEQPKKIKSVMDNQIEIYKGIDWQTQIEVKFDQETVWLNQKQMADLFEKDSDTISLHLRNLQRKGVGWKFNYRGILGSST